VDNIYEADFVANSELISNEIEKCIKSMKNKKGRCNLYPSMFHVKNCAESFSKALCRLVFNISFHFSIQGCNHLTTLYR
jgi:hypothetical protein